MRLFKTKRRESDRTLHLYGPVARKVDLLIYATGIAYGCLGIIIVSGFIYYLSTSGQLHDTVKANKAAITRLDHQDILILRLAQQGVAARKANCAVKFSLQVDVGLSETYLRDVHAGRRPRLGGITDREIQDRIDRQNNLIDSYKGLNCSKP